jgi:hypothetical protein
VEKCFNGNISGVQKEQKSVNLLKPLFIMKKFILSAVAVLASASMMALNPTAVVRITMSSADGSDVVTLIESAEDGFSAAYDNGYDAVQPDANVPGIYVVAGEARYTTVATDNLDEALIGFIAGAATDYTLTVNAASGRELKLYDNVTGETTTLSAGATYAFTATANTRVDDRFVVNPAPVATEICHRYGNLEVRGSKGMTVNVKDADSNIVLTQDIATDNVTISLAALAAGYYTVEWNGKTLTIKVD